MYVYVCYCGTPLLVCVTKYCFDLNRIRCASLLWMLLFQDFYSIEKGVELPVNNNENRHTHRERSCYSNFRNNKSGGSYNVIGDLNSTLLTLIASYMAWIWYYVWQQHTPTTNANTKPFHCTTYNIQQRIERYKYTQMSGFILYSFDGVQSEALIYCLRAQFKGHIHAIHGNMDA